MAVEDHSLVVHDWGAVALIGAQEEPDRIRKLVIINAVVLLARIPLAPHRARLADARAG